MRWLLRIPVFERALIVASAAGLIGGMVFGFVRGVSYLPTLPVAVVEGLLIAGVPAAIALVGLVVIAAGVCLVAGRLRRVHR